MILYTVVETDDLGHLHKEVNELVTKTPDAGYYPWTIQGAMIPLVDGAGRIIYYQTLTRKVRDGYY